MALHTGHRKRVRDKFETGGFTQFADHEILEALLFAAVPYRDTNPLAHTLIERGGSLADALRLPAEALAGIPSAPERLPLFFSLLSEAGRRAASEVQPAATYATCSAIRALAEQTVAGVADDRTYALYFDNAFHLLATEEVYCGYYASSAFHVQDLVTGALHARATAAVLVSTHADRIARPDPYEVAASRHMASVLHLVGVTLADHLIFAGNVCVSVVKASGALTDDRAPAAKLSDGEEGTP